jgi:hypothetical protein
MKNVGKLFTISVLILFLFGTTIPVFGVNNEQNEIIVLDYSFSSPLTEKITIKNEIYDRIRIDGLSNTNDLGIPRLPVKPVKILLPQGRAVEEIRVITSEENNLGTDFKLEVGGKLVPIFTTPVVINNKYVSSKTTPKQFSTSLFENKGVYNCRGFDILHLNLYPIQYHTDNGELSYFENMKIIVDTKESTINRAFRGLDADYLTVQNIVENPDCIETYKTNLVVKPVFLEQYDYIVITNDDLQNATGNYTFQDLLDFKESEGLTTNIVTVEWIVNNPDFNVFGPWGDANTSNPFYGSDITGNLEYFDNTSARIRNFIRFAYTEWGTQYILLGGDADEIVPDDNIIPLRGLFANESGLPLNGLQEEEEDDIPSDVYYACLDGNYNYDCDGHFGECADRNDADPVDEADLYSEIYVGRACVDSEEEVSNFVMKTLQYAQAGGEYLSKILFIGEYLGGLFYTPWGGDYKDEVESYIPSYYTLEKLYDRDDPNQNWNPYELLDRLDSDPVQFINHDGHGNENYILKMYDDDIRTLTNEKHFFIYSHSCLTGSFDNWNCWYGYVEEDCIAEILTAELEYGAYACILNARYGLGSEDTIESPSGALDESFLKALFTENIRELGPANHYSKEDNVWRIDENGIRWCFYQTNLFGDPHLSIKDPNLPPNKPTIDGPTQVTVGETHGYNISTTDPEDDDLYYHVDIDDGTGGQWYGPNASGEEIVVNITFTKKGYVTIYVYAKDIKGAVSETATLTVRVPRIRAFSNFYLLNILGRFQNLLPIISYFLRI